MVRCFVGVMIPEDLKNNIVNIQNAIKSFPIECKMVETENLHICLSFLGEIEDDRIVDLRKKLDNVCSNRSAIDIEVSGLKFIPTEKYVRVIVLDCPSMTLETLGKNIRKEIGGDVKPPHVTLCRVKNIREKEQTIDKMKGIDSCVGKFKISSIQLIKSQLEKSGPVYRILHESKLL